MSRDKMVQTGFRLPTVVIERIDHEVELSQAEHPGLSITRADAVRELLLEGLDARDRKRSRRKAS